MSVEDHYVSLHLLKEGLGDADALKMFLIAVAKAIQELDESDDCTPLQNQFLRDVDEALSSAGAVEKTRNFRRVLDQHLAEMRMYRRSPSDAARHGREPCGRVPFVCGVDSSISPSTRGVGDHPAPLFT